MRFVMNTMTLLFCNHIYCVESVHPMVKVDQDNSRSMLACFSHTFSKGITALLALGILDQIQEQGITKRLLDMEHNSPEYLHLLVEALR